MEKSKKPFYKKWWFWVIVIIIIIALSSGGGDEDATNNTATDQTTNKTDKSNIADKPTEDKEEPKRRMTGRLNREHTRSGLIFQRENI